ncbi:cytochrome b subunit of succinate dehydrogenase, Sdh3p [Borealophlyctis nickersoniae]|nr:cytochrome b subunit of succinate dehydrogenase, Sdh3p [Borealophlyctis nickersoniae]
MANYIHSLPPSLVLAAKVAVAFPLVFHTFNGCRHLLWDTTHALTNQAVIQTGYAVLVLTALGTAGLVML